MTDMYTDNRSILESRKAALDAFGQFAIQVNFAPGFEIDWIKHFGGTIQRTKDDLFVAQPVKGRPIAIPDSLCAKPGEDTYRATSSIVYRKGIKFTPVQNDVVPVGFSYGKRKRKGFQAIADTNEFVDIELGQLSESH